MVLKKKNTQLQVLWTSQRHLTVSDTEIFFYKLKSTNVPKYILHILKSFLTDRCFVIIINEIQTYRPIQAGVTQGSKLGLILFYLYISDIPKTTNTNIAL